MLANVRISPCSRCTTPAFDPETIDTNRAGLCETCFVLDLQAELTKDEEAERQRLAEYDRHMNAEGMTIRVNAWVHPESGGDDYQVQWYFETKPTERQIQALLRKQGSSLLSDYEVVTLTDAT